MQIGQTIRKYRKMKNMTQEEMANRLGITAPAVNKWEKGVSFPDITLLAPIARLLGITPDILLSFGEEMTQERISAVIAELDTKLRTEPFEEVFQWVKEKLEEYPNCESLALNMASVLDAQLLFKKIERAESYEQLIRQCYTGALERGDEEIRTRAADALFGYYLRKEQYDKAEECLAYLSDQNPEKMRRQAVLYSSTGRREEAYKMYETLLFRGYQIAALLFHSIYEMALQDGNVEKARAMVEKQSVLAKLYEMGTYHEVCGRLELAVYEKDAETALETMEILLASVQDCFDHSRTSLYEHMDFVPPREEFVAAFKRRLQKYFGEEAQFAFAGQNTDL